MLFLRLNMHFKPTLGKAVCARRRAVNQPVGWSPMPAGFICRFRNILDQIWFTFEVCAFLCCYVGVACVCVRSLTLAFWSVLGISGTIVGQTWTIFEPFCCILGLSWAFLGPGSLGPSVILGLSWGILGQFGAILWPSWARLRPSWAILGPYWGHPGAILVPSLAILGPFGSFMDHLGPILGPF
jgi:hypothetical protein